MSRTSTVVASFCLALSLGGIAHAQGKAVKDIPATSAIGNCSGADFFSIRSDQPGCESGTYPHSQTIRSVVQMAGDWILETQPFKATPTRSVFVDFSNPIPGTGPNGGDPVSPFTAALVRGRFISKCHEYDVNLLDIPEDGTAICPLVLALGPEYGARIMMDWRRNPGTEPVRITCTRAAAGQCSQWTIEPYSVTSLGKSIKASTKPREPEQDWGNYRFSFRITVSIP